MTKRNSVTRELIAKMTAYEIGYYDGLAENTIRLSQISRVLELTLTPEDRQSFNAWMQGYNAGVKVKTGPSVNILPPNSQAQYQPSKINA